MGLIACDLVKQFGSVRAVDGISFQVNRGEVIGLLGPNGAGKTTVLRMLAGILTPDAGRVAIDSLEVTRQALDAKRRIGFLSGDTQLYQRMSTREILTYFGRLYDVPESELKRRIGALIEELEMGDFADRHCETLSSGQRQRANIARAFLHEPDVLILDEPTNALDVVSGRFIVDAIQRKKAAGRAVLFSTHIMSEAEYLCDRIVMIHQGCKLAEGTVREILARSGCTNLTDAFLTSIGRERKTIQ